MSHEQTFYAVVFALIVSLMLMAQAMAQLQSQTFYGADGRVTGRSTTDSGGSTIFYGADGRMAGRSSSSGNSTIFYGADGRMAGRSTTSSGTTPRKGASQETHLHKRPLPGRLLRLPVAARHDIDRYVGKGRKARWLAHAKKLSRKR